VERRLATAIALLAPLEEQLQGCGVASRKNSQSLHRSTEGRQLALVALARVSPTSRTGDEGKLRTS
jgi:hypothetical protein